MTGDSSAASQLDMDQAGYTAASQDIYLARTPFERDLLTWVRQANFRLNRPRVIVLVWNGNRLCLYDAQQVR